MSKNEEELEILALHPMLTTNDESSSSTKQTGFMNSRVSIPVLLNEDNIIQSLEDAREERLNKQNTFQNSDKNQSNK